MASKTGRIVNFALKNQNIFSIRLPTRVKQSCTLLFLESFPFGQEAIKEAKWIEDKPDQTMFCPQFKSLFQSLKFPVAFLVQRPNRPLDSTIGKTLENLIGASLCKYHEG